MDRNWFTGSFSWTQGWTSLLYSCSRVSTLELFRNHLDTIVCHVLWDDPAGAGDLANDPLWSLPTLSILEFCGNWALKTGHLEINLQPIRMEVLVPVLPSHLGWHEILARLFRAVSLSYSHSDFDICEIWSSVQPHPTGEKESSPVFCPVPTIWVSVNYLDSWILSCHR